MAKVYNNIMKMIISRAQQVEFDQTPTFDKGFLGLNVHHILTSNYV
jgi:hypothetical protein